MIGTTELMIILGVAALIFGSSKLPSIARDVGKALGEVNKAEKELERLKSDFTSEIQSSIQDPIQSSIQSTMESTELTMQSEPVPEQNIAPEEKSNDPDDVEDPHEPDIEGRIKDEAFKYIGSKFKSKIFR
ncbi:MAG: twin-arginine translocase TatA/TatE family subunit [Methanocellales archaeon]|nr:twin-arginine translocase TatA/TatE family subunit [Methanocellales archaeon]MDD3421586.1 twin-arginine translocase TatA/TatE family subunit [Methanocellales archaeon]MDD4898129.1 twin-arginine translocase TatA/TatE family subunit [Methanocellales archaeon]MDD5447178.1 twin-arginine translocase TatA/TatE family subunit [Methanocellales archaeon]